MNTFDLIRNLDIFASYGYDFRLITGKKTYYTACLVYADEDEGMAETINKLYRRVYPKATFFRPQFDMKRGKFELDTTATVIQKRCGGKAIFILSEYFFASDVCQFAVNFTAAVCRGAGAGNLVPFHLTYKTEHVPAVLQGIAGVRWFRKNTRKYAWEQLTDSIIANGLQNEEEKLNKVYEEIHRLLDSEPSTYLMDPPYDDDTPLPGEPIKVIEPPEISEYLKKQSEAYKSRTPSPPRTETRLEKFKKSIRTLQERIYKIVRDDTKAKPYVEDDIEILYQRVADPELNTHSERNRKCKSDVPVPPRRGVFSIFTSVSSPSFTSSQPRDSRNFVPAWRTMYDATEETDGFVIVDAQTVRGYNGGASVNMRRVIDSHDESCQLLVSEDFSKIMFTRLYPDRSTSSNITNVRESTNLDESPAVSFFTCDPEEMTSNDVREAGSDLNNDGEHNSLEDDHMIVDERNGSFPDKRVRPDFIDSNEQLTESQREPVEHDDRPSL